MADRSSGHLIENKIGFRYDRVFLVDMLDRGCPAMSPEQVVEIAGSKRMATSLVRRGLVVEARDGSLRLSSTAQDFAKMWKARETKKDRVKRGLVDVVVAFPANDRRDVVRFHGRTEFGRMLIDMHPLTSTGEPIDVAVVRDITRHMRNDGAIVDDRSRTYHQGIRPDVITDQDHSIARASAAA